ncbi:MAG TPA: GGDEF domain-containing protein [Jatrophihabitans sp.]|nr:GGDEF domain-containing protein [Jatrophihabitans sp.]
MSPRDTPPSPARRPSPGTHRGVLRLTERLARSWDPVAGGRLMLLCTGLVVLATLPMLAEHLVRTLGVMVALVTAVSWLVVTLLPWQRLPRWATLLLPVFAWTALAVMGYTEPGISGNYSGLYVLWFAYLGLTRPPGTSLALLPLAGLDYLISWGGPSWTLLVRVLIASAVWVLLGELLAALIQRQNALATDLRALARIDTLTNLANRRDLDERLAGAGPGDTVVLCDLDHFKQLNDTLGHAAGDTVLAEFGLVIRATLRQPDYAARYGGEEFALLLPATSAGQAATLLTRLRQRWAVLHPEVTFSAGIATCRADASAADALAEADRAMYAAKAAGRNRDHGVGGPVTAPASPAELIRRSA